MIKGLNKKGLTLIEIIILLAIMGVAVPPLLMSFARVVATGADSVSSAVVAHLAQEKMEEMIRGKGFDEIVSAGPTSFASPFSSYEYQTIVDFVTEADLNTAVGNPTDFKRIRIITTRQGSVSTQVSTVITDLGE